MKKGKSVGVVFFGYITTIGGILFTILSFIQFPVNVSIALFWLSLGVVSIAIGIGLLRLKEWARKAETVLHGISVLLMMVLSVVLISDHNKGDLIVLLPLFIIALISALIFYYFTRPQIKEQFKNEQGAGSRTISGTLLL